MPAGQDRFVYYNRILMCEYEKKYCPRCRIQFECNADNILLCQCKAVSLCEVEMNYLHQKFKGCLCANCMEELKTEFHNNLPGKNNIIFGINKKNNQWIDKIKNVCH